MSKFIYLFLIFFPLIGFSQIPRHAGSDGIPRYSQILDLSGEAIPVGTNSIEGTPFLQQGWAFGIITLTDGRIFTDSAINYSLADGKLFVKRNANIYSIKYPVKEFLIHYTGTAIEKKTYLFQKGFPEIRKNNTSTFYQVLAAGKLMQLLKWSNKKVEEINSYGGPVRSEYAFVQQYFIFYSKENKIVELGNRVNLKALTKIFPEHSENIIAFTTEHKLNLKQDEDIIRLFSFLDSAKFK